MNRTTIVAESGDLSPGCYDNHGRFPGLTQDELDGIIRSIIKNIEDGEEDKGVALDMAVVVDGDIYVSETNHRVFVKSRTGTEEEIISFVNDFNNRIT